LSIHRPIQYTRRLKTDTFLSQKQHHEHFAVDMIQGGAGTSTNMNANEVIANLGNLILSRGTYGSHQQAGSVTSGGNYEHETHADASIGGYEHINPNDHVNLCQVRICKFPMAGSHLRELASFLLPLIARFPNPDTLFAQTRLTLFGHKTSPRTARTPRR
jgi:aspartate ammonia-lyase